MYLNIYISALTVRLICLFHIIIQSDYSYLFHNDHEIIKMFLYPIKLRL